MLSRIQNFLKILQRFSSLVESHINVAKWQNMISAFFCGDANFFHRLKSGENLYSYLKQNKTKKHQKHILQP